MHRRWITYGFILATAYGLWSVQMVDRATGQSEGRLVQEFPVTVQGKTPYDQCEAVKAVKVKENKDASIRFECEPRY